jgi:molybdopterin-guanine dinucleotide biosynthesis protein A
MKEDAGIDKAFLDFYGEPLYLRQFEKLSKIFGHVYISAKTAANYPKIESQNVIEDMRVVDGIDTQDLFAPTLGMLSAFEALKCEKIFFIGVDTPFISEESIRHIVSNKAKHSAARHNGKIHPTIGTYSGSIREELRSMIKNDKHKLTLLLEKIGTIFVDLDNAAELANLNRYEDYEKAINNGTNPFR